jgi:hypothetical protein
VCGFGSPEGISSGNPGSSARAFLSGFQPLDRNSKSNMKLPALAYNGNAKQVVSNLIIFASVFPFGAQPDR